MNINADILANAILDEITCSNCQNFNQKFYFKLLSPLKNQNPSYGSKVTAISDNKKKFPFTPHHEKLHLGESVT